jgi:Zn-dependent peptidase ImmA (M78 family)
MDQEQAIESLKTLLEEQLKIPVVQQALHERFAGATEANGNSRGIVVNERGHNANVWVRRMTLAHELGHLLWDPDTRLNQLTVDEYAGLEAAYHTGRGRADVVEMRANAFAVALLAPPDGITKIVAANPSELRL